MGRQHAVTGSTWLEHAEEILLGAAMTFSTPADQPRAWDLIADRLTGESFSDGRRRAVFDALAALAEAGEPLSAVDVRRKLGDVEGEAAGYLAHLLGAAMPLTHTWAAHLVALVRKGERQRAARALGRSLAMTDADSLDDAVTDAAQRLNSLALVDALDEEATEDAAMESALGALLNADQRDHSILRTGLIDVDALFQTGFAPRTMTVIAALTSRGKSAFAVQVADQLAARLLTEDAPGIVRLFSLEMGAEEIHRRRLISESGVSMDQWARRAPGRNTATEARLLDAFTRVKERRLRILASAALTPERVRAVCQRDSARHGLALVVVDYLQALETARGDETREREVARMARGLKGLAMDLNVPVIAVAQLNRQANQHDEPSLAHLRESGAIEQYADNVLLIYAREKDPEGVTWVKVAKQRNGARDRKCQVWFDGARFRFHDAEQAS